MRLTSPPSVSVCWPTYRRWGQRDKQTYFLFCFDYSQCFTSICCAYFICLMDVFALLMLVHLSFSILGCIVIGWERYKHANNAGGCIWCRLEWHCSFDAILTGKCCAKFQSERLFSSYEVVSAFCAIFFTLFFILTFLNFGVLPSFWNFRLHTSSLQQLSRRNTCLVLKTEISVREFSTYDIF